MLKKSITYEDYNGNTVTEDFYFNFTKIEILELMELNDLEANIKRLTETENAKEAYQLFKNLILSAYGEKSEDGKRFTKSPQITKNFEDSPACSELIVEFLQNPEVAAKFIEATLPAKLVAEAKAAQEASEEAAASKDENFVETAKPKFEDFTKDELMAMRDEEFQALLPDPKSMTQEQLLIAFQRKNR